jgi:hypothetical protein
VVLRYARNLEERSRRLTGISHQIPGKSPLLDDGRNLAALPDLILQVIPSIFSEARVKIET